MTMVKLTPLLSILFLCSLIYAKPLSDSLPIQGHFSQNGNSVGRFKLERFLLAHDSSVEFADRSIGYKWSGHVVGTTLWCVNLGVAAYQLNLVLDAVKKQNILLDSTGKQETLVNRLNRFTIPLTIGSEVASFVQSLLYDRSDYLLHKGALAYNASIARNSPPGQGIDLRIEKENNGWYKQDGLLMTEPVLRGMLREQPASRPYSNWSWVFKQIGIQAGEWGGMYIGLALLSYLQEATGDTSFIIDKKARDSNLRIGISVSALAIAGAIASAVTRNAAIRKYNGAIPVRNAPAAAAGPGSPVRKDATPPDSAGTGIIEGPAKVPADSAHLKKE
jgi:hypothetical protein